MPGGEQTFFCKRTYVRKRIERLFLRVTNVCSYKERTFVLTKKERLFPCITNKCSIQPRTFVRKPDSQNRNVCSGIKNICSESKANICSERMFSFYTHIRTYVLYALKDAPCLPPYAFCQNRQESGGIFGSLHPFFCEISIDFPCMKWYNVSG